MNEIEDEEELMEEEEEDTMRQRSGKRRRVEFEDGHVGREDVLEAEVESDCYLLQRLPVEVWTHILSFVLAKKSPFASLSATLLTCKLWRRIGLSLVTSYTMSPMKPKKLARKCLAFLFGNCPNLRSLRVRNCPIVNSMLYHLPERITLLDCGFTQITEEALEYLPLSLKALSIDNMAITDNGFNDLPSRLDTLSLRQVIISPISAKKMAQRFTRLRKLTLSAQVTNVTAFLPPSIECLRLHVGSIGDKNYLWNDNVIATLLPLPNLQILEISRCNITNSSKQTLAETRVRHLVIRQAKLSDDGMRYLPPTLISLMLESVPTITDAGLRGLPLAVQSMALIKMEKLTGPGLLSFLLESATNLRYLVLDEELHAALRAVDVDRKLAARRNLHISVKRENEPCPKLHQLPVHHLPPPDQ